MKSQPKMAQDSAVSSINGDLRMISLPCSIGFEKPKEVGKALIAWRYRMTYEEVETLDLLAKGLTNEEITEALGLQEIKSVKNRVQSILDKLKVENRTKAAAVAFRYGLGEENLK